ncbi:hypothetical protein [Sphingomonas sp. R1]|uniref:hypothetical protein n=1 Tax=Sphingomonas sp. R1 TaxID=399176 RepID=UPI00222523AD|nr:hypothetical protein [Sphingomonas sp. R1]UYY76872.1 hypothetical protein OIM94_15395 [Sphingomonas sp. R1]
MATAVTTLLQELDERHAAIEAGIGEIEEHCSRDLPDLVELAAVRVRLSRASTERSRFVREVVVPKILEQADPALLGELSQMIKAFSAKRVASSKHVAAWSSWTIQQNWYGYKEASRAIREMMRAQIERERKTLRTRLEERGL